MWIEGSAKQLLVASSGRAAAGIKVEIVCVKTRICATTRCVRYTTWSENGTGTMRAVMVALWRLGLERGVGNESQVKMKLVILTEVQKFDVRQNGQWQQRRESQKKEDEAGEKVEEPRSTYWRPLEISAEAVSLKRRVRSHLTKRKPKKCMRLWREARLEPKSGKRYQFQITFGS